MKLHDFTEALENKYSKQSERLNEDLTEIVDPEMDKTEPDLLDEAPDLSKVASSITSLLIENTDLLNSCMTKEDVLNTVQNLLNEKNIDTEASRRLILNISKSKNLARALNAVWNFILKGSGEGVI